MKDAMWAVDPVGGLRFSDRLAGQAVLFGDEPDFAILTNAIRINFLGHKVDVAEVERFVLVQTPFKASHFKRQVLSPLKRMDSLAWRLRRIEDASRIPME